MNADVTTLCPLFQVYESLTKKGLKLGPPKVAPYGMKQLYLADPDGYGICFQWKAWGGEALKSRRLSPFRRFAL